MKTSLLVATVLYVLVLIIFPLIVDKVFIHGGYLYETIVGISGFMVFCSSFLPSIILLVMLQHEMKHPDLWLHSTASIYKLIGSKIFLASIVGVGALFIPFIIVIGGFSFWDLPISFAGLLAISLTIVIVAFLSSIEGIAITLLFWVIYRLLRKRIGKFSVAITLFLFLVAGFAYMKFSMSDFYLSTLEFGPIPLHFLSQFSSFFEDDFNNIFYIGNFLWECFITAACFMLAVVLFDKKARY